MGILALLRARESSGPDDGDHGDDQSDDEAANDNRYQARPGSPLRMRCSACRGSGQLALTDEICPRGRMVRCIACHGFGRVWVV
jgi:hypothetical protein